MTAALDACQSASAKSNPAGCAQANRFAYRYRAPPYRLHLQTPTYPGSAARVNMHQSISA